MGTQEQPCYTLIQGPADTEQPSEMQLKQDLGKHMLACINKLSFAHVVAAEIVHYYIEIKILKKNLSPFSLIIFALSLYSRIGSKYLN